MMHTEDEAKTKWCPMVRVTVAVGPAGDVYTSDNHGNDGIHPECIGSACMVWRWASYEDSAINEGGPDDFGYCGLVRQP